MRIFDMENQEITNPDLSAGRLIHDKNFVCHHEAVQEVVEQFHLEVKETYANGGHDMKKVIDVAYVPPQDAWDEYEDILRYVPFTDEELEGRNKPNVLSLLAEALQPRIAPKPAPTIGYEVVPRFNLFKMAIEWDLIKIPQLHSAEGYDDRITCGLCEEE